MFPGVRPSIILASLPTAATAFCPPLRSWRTATTDGSFRTMPCPRTKIRVLAVPRSMDRSLENMPRNFLNIGGSGPAGGRKTGPASLAKSGVGGWELVVGGWRGWRTRETGRKPSPQLPAIDCQLPTANGCAPWRAARPLASPRPPRYPSQPSAAESPDVRTDLRFPGLRHHHGVPRPVQEPHPAGQGAHPERLVPGAPDAARVRRLRRQHRLQPQ